MADPILSNSPVHPAATAEPIIGNSSAYANPKNVAMPEICNINCGDLGIDKNSKKKHLENLMT